MRQAFFIILIVLFHLFPFTLASQFTAITNEGQWPDHVATSAQLNGGNIFFANNAVHYNFIDSNYLASRHAHHRSASGEGFASDREEADRLRGHHYQMHFKNASENARISFQDQYQGRANYFLGNDPKKWGRNAKRYGKVTYENIYEGVDCAFLQSEDGHLKYEFTLEPGADPSDIQLRYDHVNSLRLTDKGQLKIGTSVNKVTEYIPLVYQPDGDQKDTIRCEYSIKNQTVYFKFPEGYDTSRQLVIDPVLTFSSFSGSFSDNFGFTATYDTTGHLYGGGIAFGNQYPTTEGAYDTTHVNVADISITKFSQDGSQLVYSTYIGGKFAEMPHSLVVGPDTNLYIFGITGSKDFPTTYSAFDTTFNGGVTRNFVSNGAEFGQGTDIYLAKLDASGSDLLASTFLGGSHNDGLNSSVRTNASYPDTGVTLNYGDIFRGEIVVDHEGMVYVASCTKSSDFPVTAGAVQTNFQGIQDGLLIKMDSELSSLEYASYIGGSHIDASFSVKLDPQNNIVTSGGTCSDDFPTSAGSYQTSFGGGVSDGFLAKFSNDGGNLLASTYIGDSHLDISYFIDFDYDNNIYITGSTDSDNYPIVGNNAAFSESGQFITKFDENLDTILMSTRFGSGFGRPELSPTAFLVDDCKNIYVSGWGGSTNGSSLSQHPRTFLNNMPLTNDAYQTSTDGSDFYFIVFSEDADSLIYASYFGGNISNEHVDGGTSRFDKDGIIYQAVCAGCRGNSDFPTTPGAWSNTNNSSNCNLGVLKFEFQLLEVKADAIAGPDTFDCAPLQVQFENLGTENAYYHWDFDNGDFAEKENPNYTYMEPGSYTPTLIVKPRKPCLIGDTTQLHVEVLELTEAAFNYSPQQIELKEQVNFTNLSKGGNEYRWFLDGEPVSNNFNWQKQFEKAGYYNVCLEIENEQCVDSICKELVVPIIGVPNAFSPNGDGHNDVLYVKGLGVTELDFRVYNRWGELMFQTNDLEKGWDGTYKGKPQEMDTYVYVLNATLENGNVIDEKGNITLIR